jgi:antitoxin ParD1/3/4
MNVSLTPELESFVEQTVRSGRYGSASEAVREGLRLLQEREAKFQALKRDIEEGLASGQAQEESFAQVAEVARREWEQARGTRGPKAAAE